MTDKFTSLAGYAPDDASDIGIRIRVLAEEIYSIGAAVDWLRRETDPRTAGGAQLDLLAQERGLSRKGASYASGTLTFSVPAALWFEAEISAGTVCSTAGENPARYVTTQAAVLPQGSLCIAVPAQAEAAGAVGNVQAGTVTAFVTVPAAITAVTNAAAFTGGEDAEGDEALRSRILASYAEVSNGTNAAWYRQTALQVPGVDSVQAVPRANGAGSVLLYLGGRGSVPPADTVHSVSDALNALREIDVTVSVQAAAAVPTDVSVTVKAAPGALMPDAQMACVSAVKDYFLGLGVGDSVLLSALGAKLFATGLISDCVFSSSGKTMAAGQLAVCGSVTVAAGG
jgi:uncharacterized phage protein gp47/JayE